MQEGGLNEGKFMTVQDIMDRNIQQTKAFIETIETEQSIEDSKRVETIESHRNAIKADLMNTEMKKNKLISEIKAGLGDELKENKGVRRVVEDNKTITVSLADRLRAIFTKF
jgi:hypothetical protein